MMTMLLKVFKVRFVRMRLSVGPPASTTLPDQRSCCCAAAARLVPDVACSVPVQHLHHSIYGNRYNILVLAP